MASAFCFAFGKNIVKRSFLTSKVSAGNITLCREQCVARELRVERKCSTVRPIESAWEKLRATFQISLGNETLYWNYELYNLQLATKMTHFMKLYSMHACICIDICTVTYSRNWCYDIPFSLYKSFHTANHSSLQSNRCRLSQKN